MQKAGPGKLSFLVLLLCFGISKALIAQQPVDTLAFTWKLLEVADPTLEAKVLFTPRVPTPSRFTSWDFGDSSTSTTDSIATHSYSSLDTFNVTYSFKINAKDSTVTYKVFGNSAAFIARLDSNTNVTYSRVLRSCFRFIDNSTTLIGNMRFEWAINGTVLIDTVDRLVNFPGAFGQFPNIRYTFKKAGTYTVSLRAWNVTNAAKDVTFTRNLMIQPNFSTKQKFVNIPNVFTPNGDNIYDYFEVQTSGLSRLVLKVFTRTGALIYQNQANFIKWDGRNDNGKDLPEGIYYYIIEDLDGQYENAKGFVYIFRGK
jgi:gliding motility-associated-like protein